jgi:orotidine-5'-phosphate decarboxylase
MRQGLRDKEAEAMVIVNPRERILLALDVDNLDAADRLVTDLSPYVGGFKIGMQLANKVGAPQAVNFIHSRGGKVFLDEKFKDILNTVAGAARAAAELGVMMFNVHADGGPKMMRAAMEAVNKYFADNKRRPFVLGVTVLTSMSAEDLEEIGYPKGTKPEELVRLLAIQAQKSGLDGVIASAREARLIRETTSCDDGFIIVTPAIQPEWATWAQQGTDQKRPTTHVEAIQATADYLVIGRALLKAPQPIDAAKRIADEIDAVKA